MTLNQMENILRSHPDYFKWYEEVFRERLAHYRSNKGAIEKRSKARKQRLQREYQERDRGWKTSKTSSGDCILRVPTREEKEMTKSSIFGKGFSFTVKDKEPIEFYSERAFPALQQAFNEECEYELKDGKNYAIEVQVFELRNNENDSPT